MFLGDCTAEFRRGRGPDRKPRRRRGVLTAAGVTAGGAGVGAVGAHKAIDRAYEVGIKSLYPKANRQVGKQSRRIADATVRKVLSKPGLHSVLGIDRSTRLLMRAYVNPGKAGAIAGGTLALGGYGAYRLGRYGIRKARGRQ